MKNYNFKAIFQNFNENFAIFTKVFKKNCKNRKIFIEILKNCPKIVIFHWVFLKKFSSVRGALPPGTPHAATPYKPLALSKKIPPPRPPDRVNVWSYRAHVCMLHCIVLAEGSQTPRVALLHFGACPLGISQS